jgi:hypothetical protein
MTSIYLPVDRATIWGGGQDTMDFRAKWYQPVRYYTQAKPGFRLVEVPKACLEGGWFHPDRHENLPALAELLS